MNLKKASFGMLAATCLVAGSLVAQPAAAQHWHGGYGGWHGGWHGGWGVGVVVAPGYGYWGPGYGYWGVGPWYDYPGYYYPPAAAVAPSGPTTYVERSDGAAVSAAPQGGNYWYHCESPSGYYPYVKQCPGGWERVSPQPPGNAQ